MRGRDPRIHAALQRMKAFARLSSSHLIMDCRVKPGNDGGEAYEPTKNGRALPGHFHFECSASARVQRFSPAR
jgi:hypothetical protein